MKKQLLVLTVAGICAASSQMALATTSTGFGSIPGVTQAQNPYSGNGIPINASVWEQTTLPGPSILIPQVTLTMALSTTAHGSSNPTPGNNGVNTFSVGTGLSGGRSLWNFDYYGSKIAGLSYSITITDGYGHSVSFDPSAIPDDVDGPGAFGNSESLDFAFLGGSLAYNPNLDDTYYVDFDAKNVAGATVGDVKETIVDGAGHNVPDGGNTLVMLGSGLACVGFAVIKKRKAGRSVSAPATA